MKTNLIIWSAIIISTIALIVFYVHNQYEKDVAHDCFIDTLETRHLKEHCISNYSKVTFVEYFFGKQVNSLEQSQKLLDYLKMNTNKSIRK